MSTGNTVSCIRSILWKPYRVRRRKEGRGGLAGALAWTESGYGAQSGIWKMETTEFTVLGWQCHPFLFQ